MKKHEDYQAISNDTGYSVHEIDTLHKSIAKGLNISELSYFLGVCKSVGLNPFIREIWCYKDRDNKLVVFAGRDGFLAKAQQSENWNGIASSEVCENDLFELVVANGDIQHTISGRNRGEIFGAYAISQPKGTEIKTIEYVEIEAYDMKKDAWLTHKADMLKKVAESKALKKSYGISGIQSEYEFKVADGVALPISHEKVDEIEQKADEIRDLLEVSDKEESVIEKFRKEAIKAHEDGSFTIESANELIERIKS